MTIVTVEQAQAEARLMTLDPATLRMAAAHAEEMAAALIGASRRTDTSAAEKNQVEGARQLAQILADECRGLANRIEAGRRAERAARQVGPSGSPLSGGRA